MHPVKVSSIHTCRSYLGIRVRRAEQTSNGLDGIYGKKGCDREEWDEKERGEKAECGGRSAVGGYGRDYGTVVRVA